MAAFECKECGCNESVCVRTYPGSESTGRVRRCMKCGQFYKTEESMVPITRVFSPDPNRPKAKKKKAPPPEPEIPEGGNLKRALQSAK